MGLLSSILILAVGMAPAPDLESAFRRPPSEAGPHVWWHWTGYNVTSNGITRDLEAMASAGVAGATVFTIRDHSGCAEDAAEMTNRICPSMSYGNDVWWAHLRFAAEEARRLGLQLGMHNCPGFSVSGGPWIDPEHAMKGVVWTSAPAPKRPPEPDHGALGWYRDIGETSFGGVNYRFGYVALKRAPHPMPADIQEKSLECDKLATEAVGRHLDAVLIPLKARLGDLIGGAFRYLLMDSYEAGDCNWTQDMREEFVRRRGYDPLPHLPALAGAAMPDADRFRADLKRTVGELFVERHTLQFRRRLNEAGLEFHLEPYSGPFDGREASALCDVPMVEFWATPLPGQPPEAFGAYPGFVADVARANGQRIIAAEAFTGRGKFSDWITTPRDLKAPGDASFARGINRLVLHHWVHQPFPRKWRPGNAMGFWGTHFGDCQTWFEPGKAWYRYLQRCQAMLQRGESVSESDLVRIGGSAELSRPVLACARREGETLFFFVANTSTNAACAELSFKVSGRIPEKWSTERVTVEDLPDWRVEGGRTELSLPLAPLESAFIVFRRSGNPSAEQDRRATAVRTLELGGTWEVSFEPGCGAPEGVHRLQGLSSLSECDCPGIRFFSGTATYGRTIPNTFLPAGALWHELDLGDVRDLAEVFVDGRRIAVLWHPPYRVRLDPGLFRKPRADLVVRVTNAWHNRLVGDEQEPDDCEWMRANPRKDFGRALRTIPDFVIDGGERPSRGRIGFSTWNYFGVNSRLIPSGLIGPVRLHSTLPEKTAEGKR